ncbi:MAG: gene transfer agent family protein [Pseudomonadota bacterium]
MSGAANPWTGEVSIWLDGEPYRAKLTLGALAELEAQLGEGSLMALVERFEADAVSSADVLALIVAALRGGGWHGKAEDLLSIDIQGGPVAAARTAARALALAFSLPGEGA